MAEQEPEKLGSGQLEEVGQLSDIARAGRVLREQLVLVLVRPQQAGNVGAVARAMKNMGLKKLVVVAPPAFDVDRARWMAPGSAEILNSARYVKTVAEAVADCHRVVATTARDRHWRWPSFDLEQFAPQPFEQPEDLAAWTRTAILFGPEDSGLSNEDIAYAHALLHIQTDSNASLNLSQAVLLVAASLFAQARERGWYGPASDGIGQRGGCGGGRRRWRARRRFRRLRRSWSGWSRSGCTRWNWPGI